MLFLYYTNTQLGYIFGYLLSDPAGFIANINLNFSYVTSLITLGAMVLSLASGLYILVGSRAGQMLAATFAIITIMLFVYQYVGSQTQYFVIIAAFQFAVFLSSIRSAASGAQVYNQAYEKGPDYPLVFGYGAKF